MHLHRQRLVDAQENFNPRCRLSRDLSILPFFRRQAFNNDIGQYRRWATNGERILRIIKTRDDKSWDRAYEIDAGNPSGCFGLYTS